MSRGKRYIEVPADDLLGMLRDVGTKVRGAGGNCVEGVQGREVVFDIVPPEREAFLRVFTTLTRGADTVRDCGADAIRLVVGHRWAGDDGKIRFGPLARSRKLLRTAPKGTEEERITAFLERLKGALRDGYREALSHPTCPKCGNVMRLREPREGGKQFKPFWGCVGYPKCKETKRA